MTHTLWIPALFALFAWWFSTGAILWVVRRADQRGGDAYRMAVLAGVPVLLVGVLLLQNSVNDASIGGAYRGFLAALAIWGWLELTFLTGVLTGPLRAPCPPGLSGMDRFTRAWNAIAYHELALFLGLLTVIAVTAQGVNPTASYAFAVLFIARISAKLNIFFGVPRINTEFVPQPLQHLTSYFRRAPVTPFFAASVTLLSLMVGCCVQQIWTAPSVATATSFTLIAALATLALLEHWFMLLPLPDAKLWRWMLPSRQDPNSTEY